MKFLLTAQLSIRIFILCQVVLEHLQAEFKNFSQFVLEHALVTV